jgi:hypothetical protein
MGAPNSDKSIRFSNKFKVAFPKTEFLGRPLVNRLRKKRGSVNPLLFWPVSADYCKDEGKKPGVHA